MYHEHLASLNLSGSLYDIFNGVDDQFWRWVLTEDGNPKLKGIVPAFPCEEIQKRFNSKAGGKNLDQAFAAYSLFKKITLNSLGSLQNQHILDFGCGWGRILRFWLKDLPGEQIWGVDCQEEAISLCRDNGLSVTLKHTPVIPPSGLPESHFGLVYAWSVFSHLSQQAADKWIGEFSRLLKPGGVLILTTRPRSFFVKVERMKQSGQVPEWATRLYGQLSDNIEKYLKAYDKGEFLFLPTGGGPNLNKTFYGEAYVSKGYVEKQWTKNLELIDFFDTLSQSVIVLQKKPL